MKGLWWLEEEKDLSLKENLVDPPIIKSNEIKIKLAYAGICGSDIHYMEGNMGKWRLKSGGLIMGHEFSGTVIGAGKDSKYNIGDRVCVNPSNCCGECSWYSESLPHFCPNNITIGVERNGGWAEYCVVEDNAASRLPDSVTLKEGVLGEPYSCVLRGWRRLQQRPPKDARVLIQGAGIIGLLFCTMLHNNGYTNVIVAEIHEGRRKLCREMGLGYDAVDPQEVDLMLAGKDVDVQGFHLIIDCTGSTAAVQKTIQLARRGAKILVFGCCAAGKTISIEPFQLFWKELTILGTFINPNCFEDTMDLLAELSAGGYLGYHKLGIKEFKVDQFKEALESLKNGEASKAMFKFE